MERLDVDAVRGALDENTLTLLDVREQWEFELAHVEGSVHIPMGEVPLRAAELDPDQPLAVICHHGMRSLQVALFLEQQGFSRVMNVEGGIDAWARRLDPEMPRY